MGMVRRLFVVPLGNNNHGKTTLVNGLLTAYLLTQGLGRKSPGQKGVRELTSPTGRVVDAYVFVRSYQEKEKKPHKTVAKALKANDPGWKRRDLIILPSHVANSSQDVDEMIAAAHSAGFDIVCAAIVLDDDKQTEMSEIWEKNWDERWTLMNPHQEDEEDRNAQRALGCDLWTWICKTLTP
jgi:hypothetical protein